MTIFYSGAIYGLTVAFNAATDLINFNEGETANSLTIAQSGSNAVFSVFTGAAVQPTFTLSGVDIRALDSANFTLADGGQVLIGDNTHGTANDDLANVITSSGVGASVLMGLGGDDTLTGNGAFDFIYGGDGDDTLYGGLVQLGGAGNDHLVAAASSSSLVYLDGGPGNDTLDANGNNLAVADYFLSPNGVSVNLGLAGPQVTGYGTDTLIGFHSVLGSQFNDTLIGGAGNDGFAGAAGNDVIDGGGGFNGVDYSQAPGPTTVDLANTGPQNTGSWGIDTITNIQGIWGSAFNDTLSGNAQNNNILGNGGDDNISGRAGDDGLYGGAGDDTLDGGAGNDSLDGGAGVDAANYADAASGVVVDLTHVGSQNTVGAGVDTLASIESVLGSNFADTLTGSAAPGYTVVYGAAGNDLLKAAPSAAGFTFLAGGAGDDTMDANGNPAQNVMASYATDAAGVTVNLGMSGVAQNTGGSGFDTLIGIHAVAGSAFNDSLIGSSGNDTFAADVSAVVGFSGDDTIDGGAGFNTLTYIFAAHGVTVSLGVAGAQHTGSGTETISNIQALAGSNFDDALTGNGGANYIAGGNGDDTLVGGAGDDTLDGGAGLDVASYANAPGAVSVDLSHVGPQNTGGAGVDTLTSIETVIGSNFDDTLTGAALNSDGFSLVSGGAGNDLLKAAASATSTTVLDGGAGNDTLDANGASGLVAASYGSAASGVNVNLSLDGVAQDTGGGGVDTLIGVHGLAGSSHNDSLTGSAGNDTFAADVDANLGASGNDTIDGGAGVDTLTYTFATAGVHVDLTVATAQSIGAGTETISNIENLSGSSFNDTLVGSAGANLLYGDTGDDALYGGLGNDTLAGGAGDDTLDGGKGTNTANYADANGAVTVNLNLTTAQNTGSEGKDTLKSIQVLVGSDFNDTLTGDAHNNVLTGGNGDDSLYGGAGNDTLEGGVGNDFMDGGIGTNTATYAHAASGVSVSLLTASPQATGGAGTDSLLNIQNLIGSAFNDTLEGSAGNNILDGGLGSNTVTYADAVSAVTVSLATTAIQNTVGAGTDQLKNFTGLIGSAFDDVLTGGTKNDTISGGAGNDTITGGKGGDNLTGGAGADHFVYLLTTDSTVATKGQDVITDFSSAQVDKIDLSAIDANTLVSGDQAFTWSGSAFTHVAGQLIELTKTGGFLIEGDVNGDGKADFGIFVNGSTALGSGDFIL
jgi:Ca2+-binding RTX toxin-like protein